MDNPKVVLKPRTWNKLKSKALFVVPKILELRTNFALITYDGVKRAGEGINNDLSGPLGLPVVRAACDANPVKHSKAQDVIKAFNAFVSQSNEKGLNGVQLAENDIVFFVFRINKLQNYLYSSDLTVKSLASQTGLSEMVIENIKRGGRASLTICRALLEGVRKMAMSKFDGNLPDGLKEFSQLSFLDTLINADETGTTAIYRANNDIDWMFDTSDLNVVSQIKKDWIET